MKLIHVCAGALLSVVISSCGQSSSPTPPVQQDQEFSPMQARNTLQSEEILTSQSLESNNAAPAGSMANTYGRIGVAHIFDTSAADIDNLRNRFDVIWGSFDPSPWRHADPSALVSRYYILEEDSYEISGRNLAWWEAHKPSWILYACTPSGHLTTEVSYTPGVGFPDVTLDISNPDVIDYQVRSLASYAIAHHYNAVAIDEVLLENVMLGGNPRLGQHLRPGYYACGTWHGRTPVVRYRSRASSLWAADVLNWIRTAHRILAANHLTMIINHPASALTSTEESLIANVDVLQNETGFTDYGKYTQPNHAGLFNATVNWMHYIQREGKGVVTVAKFVQGGALTASQKEYAIASYLIGSEGKSDLVMTLSTYSSQAYYPEYNTRLGAPCGEMTSGGSPHIYMRRYSGGLVVLNSGSYPRSSEVAHLPAHHAYRDIEGREIRNPLSVRSNDAFVMTTSNGCE